MDEKWSFVLKKEAHCDPKHNDRRGDEWDHVAFDPENRPVLSVVIGMRVHYGRVEYIFRFFGGRITRVGCASRNRR
jgi:hypothetical protein